MRRRRIAHIPMMTATRDRITFAMAAAVETLINRTSSPAATEVARHLAIMTAALDWGPVRVGQRTDPGSLAIVLALGAMESIEKRHDGRGAWEITKDEARALRAAAARFDHALRLIPYNVYEAARIFVTMALDPVTASAPNDG